MLTGIFLTFTACCYVAYNYSWAGVRYLSSFLPWMYLYSILPVPVSEGMRYSGFIGSLKETLGAVWKPLTLIWMVMVLRAAIAQSYMTFMTVLLADRGYSLVPPIGTVDGTRPALLWDSSPGTGWKNTRN